MTLFGNICLVLATIIFLVFSTSVFGKDAPRSGDAAMGYVWGIIMFYLAFFVLMAIVAFAIGLKGGFNWVAEGSGARFLLVSAGLFGGLLTAALSLLMKGEPGVAALLFRPFYYFAPALIPLTMLIAGAVLLNGDLSGSIPVSVYKIPLTIVFWVGIAGIGIGIAGWIAESNQNAIRRMEGMQADQARYHQGYLDEIDSCNVMKDMSRILVYTDANHDQDVREKAVAKVKTNPQWQQELIRLLENLGAEEAFNFLASNEVDDKSLFPQAINTGILATAEWIRKEIKDAYHDHDLYAGQFSWQVERIIRTVNKFEGMGVDFRPAMLELRSALDQKAEVKKPEFQCTSALDQWIKSHR